MKHPVTDLQGVGPRIAEQLARLHIYTTEDLLLHLPSRYENRLQVLPIGQVQAGQSALIEGTITASELKFGQRGKRSLVCMLHDGSGILMLRLFHFNRAQQAQLQPETRLRCFGEVRYGYHCLEMVHPDYQLLKEDEVPTDDCLTPVYATTGDLHQKRLRSLIAQALHIPPDDYLPADLCEQYALMPLHEALQILHQPSVDVDTDALLNGMHPACQRLAFEELLAQRLSLRLLRQQVRQQPSPVLDSPGRWAQQLLDSLPFQLTDAQQRAWADIAHDLRQSLPMQRLVQGDVGSGKTLVAALSALQALEAGFQVAFMAPTELLAEQHWQNFARWLQPLHIKPVWLSGTLSGKARTATLTAIAEGSGQLIIGTHALFQSAVTFQRLGLLIIDEQHRFGVQQRLALRDKGADNGQQPHQLMMTATPIPRTLAMTAYADLDVSVIDELPPGRQPITTVAIPNTRRDEVIARISTICRQGQQVYWVCTLVEESESLQCQAAEETAEQLAGALTDLNIGLVHGRLKAVDKVAQMAAFQRGELHVLVATTVIEIGVDVPDATLMIIENAERLGLAQLHQLRGRVGRGQHESFCVLLYQPPLSATASERLAVLRESQDGFVIAQRDLALRGPGEVLGVRQTGLNHLRIADLQRDQALLPAVSVAGDWFLQHIPQNCDALLQRWGQQDARYAHV